jgi:hypothetical protein
VVPGKKKDFDGNVQALFYPGGRPMLISDVLRGTVNDLSAAREMALAAISAFTSQTTTTSATFGSHPTTNRLEPAHC